MNLPAFLRIKNPALWRKTVICIFTGFSSGLPLYFVLNLIPVWLKTDNIDLKVIGLMALIQLPYTLKFLWAPFLDGFSLPFLGRRRGWLLSAQLGIIAAMSLYGLLQPQRDLWFVVGISVLLTFFSATQDVVIDAFRREILADNELGLGNAVHVNAYRIASLIPGSLSLVLTDYLSWGSVFVVTALFMLPGIAMTLLAKEPPLNHAAPKTLRDTVVLPFQEFFTRKGVQHGLLVLSFIFLYKLGDSMATALASPFYLDMGFSPKDIGLIAKNAGLWPMIIFGILGGIWMLKLGINKALWLFGVVQMVTILGFVWLAANGPFAVDSAAFCRQGAWENGTVSMQIFLQAAQIALPQRIMLAVVIAAEAIGVGLGTAAFVAFIARETHPAYTATQFALLTALSAVPRTFVNASTGYLIDALGYTLFFWLCFFLAAPGMLLLFKAAPWHGDEPQNKAA
ncbi:MAG: AmpG family muropeptide MFS transporter [Neisseria sp.]|nr:AmpG family muropeptide MFS transporter [Neisseria sp.]